MFKIQLKMRYCIFMVLFLPFFVLCQKVEDEPVTPAVVTHAEFPGGDEAFQTEVLNMIHGYIDLKKYHVNGLFVFKVKIDKKGRVSDLQLSPRVKNDELFYDDMLFSVKRVRTRWKPATINGNPMESEREIRINFTTDHFDHGD